ncbi:hypothetical protein A4212_09955 [Pasteurella multocida]|uniref:DUF935 domain-containing protein n=1 Tax=Pasteurella multocida TaxID=747 RepID=UPI00094ADD4C|nr:hypothetical protein A4212_08245 [Pasteurella multocida]AUK45499.1 hypothetical protein A4212_09955 [Pasteurella multocida]
MIKMKKDLITEIATRARSYDHWSFAHYLPNPDPVLKKMGKDISVYRELLSDGQVRAGIRRRKAAIKGLQWRITPTGNNKVDEQIQTMFESLKINRIITEMLNAALFGYQVSEVLWVSRDGLLVPLDIVGKPQEWFMFDNDNNLRFKSKENSFEGESLRDQKFLVTTQEATSTNPYGLGDLSLCFWAATFKKGGFKFWLEFTEKYGSPWLIGKHPRQTHQSEKETLADALEEMIGTAIAVIPEDSSVQIIESAGKGSSSDSYEKFLNFCKAEINIALLGQNQTTEQEANRASAQAGLEVVEDIRNDDKAIIEETFNQLLEWICTLNFSVETLPKFELYEQESIDTAQVERDERLFGIGVRFSQAYLERTYGFEKGDITVQAVSPEQNSAKIVKFTEHQHNPKPIDKIIDQMGEIVQHHFDDRLREIRAKLDMASSPEEFKEILDQHIDQLDYSEYAELFAQGMTAATLLGRYEVKQEAENNE